MKQFTNESQTAKLIELGFERPKMAAPALKWVNGEPTFEPQYTIGELIEMLPDYVNIWDATDIETMERIWNVGYIFSTHIERVELIDALFDMVVKLKEEGVI